MDGSSQVERNHLGQTQLAVLQGWYNVRGRHHNLNPSSSREAGSFFGQPKPSAERPLLLLAEQKRLALCN
jgi:hypothetical protein